MGKKAKKREKDSKPAPQKKSKELKKGNNTELVDISLILDDKTFQYRKDIEANIKELAANIKCQGQLAPVFLKPLNDKYQVISGFRRISALKTLGKKEVLARIFTKVNDEKARDIAIAENVQRLDFSDLEKALLCKKLRDEGFTNKQIAKKINKSERSVQIYLSILNTPEEVQEALHKGDITLSQISLEAK